MKSVLRIAILSITVGAVMTGASRVVAKEKGQASGEVSGRYFVIQVVDSQSGRGVPLVELRTVNNIRYITDSAGLAAFYEPGLMDREVFFFVSSHGYGYPKDGFDMSGVRLKTTPGSSAVVKINRVNVAERLYRVTGGGIYRDSILAGRSVPLKEPVLNGQVVGQDSVFTCIYKDRLFWMWGDTARPSYPLGNFEMSGAFSQLPGKGGLEPSVGVDLEYLVGEDGFSRPVSPMEEPGLVWLDGLMTLEDNQGRERMVARYARLKGLSEVLDRGLVVFNDDTMSFEPVVKGGLDFMPFSNTGHAFAVDVGGEAYYYFTTPSPVAVRLRVRADWDSVLDANSYEVLTGRVAGRMRWIRFGDILAESSSSKKQEIRSLEAEGKGSGVYDVESGQKILSHNGTVYYNDYRKRWVAIFVQHFGGPSMLGEVWYCEADMPSGPWGYGRRVVTHDKYSFYNPKHHPEFDRAGGREIFFEGTYSFTFSGTAGEATPRYDYNQMMYRLDLGDKRLTLPRPVYQVKSGDGGAEYMMGGAVDDADKWGRVDSIAFYAVEPGRAGEKMAGIYRGSDGRLTREAPVDSSEALFFAAGDGEEKNPRIVPLYEYGSSSGDYLYSTDGGLSSRGFKRSAEALCMVWKADMEHILPDWKAKPVAPR
ncbi:MAG: hypothetical protein JW720_07235 [Sedimentisphaerales bacterium]|nr:hypothetical protein [Sedimentisphaerales bacterium]